MLHVPALVARIIQESRRHEAFLTRSLAALTPEELWDLDAYVGHRLGEGDSLDRLASDYKLVVDDTLREQFYFMKHGRYRFSRYEEVAGAVYLNDGYMRSYMRGLALTAFFWPNHAKMRRFFEACLPRGGEGRYLEVGPGHGFYFLSALRRGGFAWCEGIDISPSSVALTERLLASGAFGRYEGYRLTVGDFFSCEVGGRFEPFEPFDMVVMGEVLEHVEAPARFLVRAREAARPGGQVFITTCINSPAFDHIYLFASLADLESMVRSAGLAIERRLVLPYDGTSLEESVSRRLPINVAMVLRHA